MKEKSAARSAGYQMDAGFAAQYRPVGIYLMKFPGWIFETRRDARLYNTI